MAEPEINAFVTHLAVRDQVSASTQTQALSALLFLYRHVLHREVGGLTELIRSQKPTRLPVVLTREEPALRDQPCAAPASTRTRPATPCATCSPRMRKTASGTN